MTVPANDKVTFMVKIGKLVGFTISKKIYDYFERR